MYYAAAEFWSLVFSQCVLMRKHRLLVILWGMIAGVVQGMLIVDSYIFTFSSIPASLMFYSEKEPDNLWKAVIVGVVAFVVSFVITSIVYRDEVCEGENLQV